MASGVYWAFNSSGLAELQRAVGKGTLFQLRAFRHWLCPDPFQVEPRSFSPGLLALGAESRRTARTG
jgi:hypothetical protein